MQGKEEYAGRERGENEGKRRGGKESDDRNLPSMQHQDVPNFRESVAKDLGKRSFPGSSLAARLAL